MRSEILVAWKRLWVTSAMRDVRGELDDQLFNVGRRLWVQSRAWLVEQEHLGLDRQGTGDAEALLLPTRETNRGEPEPVLDRVPQCRLA